MTASTAGGPEPIGWLVATRRGLGSIRTNPELVRLLGRELSLATTRPLALVALTVVAFDTGGAPLLGGALVAVSGMAGIGSLVLTAVAGQRPPAALARAGVRVAATGMFVAAIGAAASTAGFVVVVVGIGLVTVGGMMHRTGRLALFPTLATSVADLTTANALAGLGDGVGFFIGPVLGAVMLVVIGPVGVFGFGVVLLLLGMSVGSRVGRSRAAGETPAIGGGSLRGVLRDQWQTLQSSVVRYAVAAVVVQTFLAGVLGVAYAPLAIEKLGMGDAGIGILQAGFGAGAAVGGVVLFGVVVSGRMGLFTAVGLAAWGVFLAGLGFVGGPVVAVAATAAIGGANVLFDLAVNTLLQRSVPDSLRPGVFGTLELAVVVGVGLGAATAPPLVARVGLTAGLVATASVAVAAAVMLVWGLVRIDRDDAVPADRLALFARAQVFGALPATARGVLALRCRSRRVEAGQVLMRRGDRGDTYHLIEEGVVAVEVDGVRVAELTSPDGFGEIALLRDGRRTATVVALTPVRLLDIDRATFRAATSGRDGGRLLAAAEARLEHPAHQPDIGDQREHQTGLDG